MQEQVKERIIGILNHENQKLLSRFLTVGEYLSYKTKALVIARSMFDILFQPYVLRDFVESIEEDKLYFSAIHILPLDSAYGKRVTEYNLKIAELTLEAATSVTGGAFRWTKYEDEGIVTIFVWIDPDGIDEHYTWMANQLGNTNHVTSDNEDNPVSSLN